MLDREAVNAFCASFPGAVVSDPWGGGHDCWKVGGKMFAEMGSMNHGVCLKTESVDTAQLLIEQGVAVKAPYMHASWIMIVWDNIPDEEFRARITHSYHLIRDKLPKKVQATLGDF